MSVALTSMTCSLVSVIVPTYNRANLLPQALASVLRQTHKEYELIVVDDGSTDNTQEIVASFAPQLSRPIRYIHQVNRGEPAARNRGLAVARGTYVAFLDSDDHWTPGYLASCVSALSAVPEAGAAFMDHGISRDGKTFVPTDAGKIGSQLALLRRLATRDLVLASDAVMVRRSVFAAVGGFEEKLQVGTDWEMWVRIASLFRMIHVPGIGVIVYQHVNNTASQPVKIDTHVRNAIAVIMDHAHPEVRRLRRRILARGHLDTGYFFAFAGAPARALEKLVRAVCIDPGILGNGFVLRTLARIGLGNAGYAWLQRLVQRPQACGTLLN